MSDDRTEHQSPQDQQRARRLSVQRTQPPGDAPGYEIQRFLGAGAYGEVWVGLDRNTGRRVAIKFYLHRGGLDWTLLTREVEKLVFLSADRYVVQLLDVGWHADPPYYVMEYVENGSLEDVIAEQGTLAPEQAVEIFREVAIGLTHAHGKGVLHCDLKPANILLDQDLRPRLADFGQSRLSHEQTPALGTLFYMAPEQADLNAVPDASWDVYALGALLYCMLTGSPPHRNESGIKRIDAQQELAERLACYRREISTDLVPDDHRMVPGMDGDLAEIVDTCLKVDPQKRFANAQRVLDALDARDATRTRRPLVVLGLVGPILLLAIMFFFWWGAFHRAVNRSESMIKERTYQSNQFAAKFAAKSFEAELAEYFGLIEEELRGSEFLDVYHPVLVNPMLETLNDAQAEETMRRQTRERFLEDGPRTQLRDYLQRRLGILNQRDSGDATPFASIFVTDDWGTIIAVAYTGDIVTRSVGNNYSWRTYFHGCPEDHEKRIPVGSPEHIQTTHLSAAFKSSSTLTWKVAISAPIYDTRDGESRFLGVMALTINVGDFSIFRSRQQDSDSIAVLIDDRDGRRKGTILQHPLFHCETPAEDYSASAAAVSRVRIQPVFDYRDPLAAAPGGEAYEGEWIAAAEPVRLPARGPEADRTNSDPRLLLLVQASTAATTAPVRELRTRLTWDAALALGVVILTVLALWFIVLRISGQRFRSRPHRRNESDAAAPPSPPSTLSLGTRQHP